MRRILLFFLLFPTVSFAESDYFALPLVLRHEGLGGVYGLGAGIENILGKGSTLLVGGAGGEVQAAGVLLGEVPLSGDFIKMSAFAATASEATFQTDYGRALVQGETYEQQVSGSLIGVNCKFLFFDQTLITELGLSQSTLVLEDYFFEGELVQRPNTANYHDINTSQLSLQFHIDMSEGYGVAQSGVDIKFGATNMVGRTGQILYLSALGDNAALQLAHAKSIFEIKAILEVHAKRGTEACRGGVHQAELRDGDREETHERGGKYEDRHCADHGSRRHHPTLLPLPRLF